jgi:DNA-binding MarR family transcriptional regulator
MSSEDSETLDFKQSLFASYANTAMMELTLYNNNSDHLRPTHKEMLYLYCIWNKEDCTATDLVQLFDSSKALVSQTIIGMEKKGLIYREKDPNDNRRQILKTSEKRLSAAEIELKILDDSIRKLSEKYSKEELENAAKIILTFTEQMYKEALNQKNKTK